MIIFIIWFKKLIITELFIEFDWQKLRRKDQQKHTNDTFSIQELNEDQSLVANKHPYISRKRFSLIHLLPGYCRHKNKAFILTIYSLRLQFERATSTHMTGFCWRPSATPSIPTIDDVDQRWESSASTSARFQEEPKKFHIYPKITLVTLCLPPL